MMRRFIIARRVLGWRRAVRFMQADRYYRSIKSIHELDADAYLGDPY